MVELECRVCKKPIIEDERCLGLMYGKNMAIYEGFAADEEDLPDVLCMECESIVYDAIDDKLKKA